MITTWLSTFYILAAAGASFFGLLGLVTLWYYWRHRHDTFPRPPLPVDQPWPQVTVQLPIFNERFVVRRLIDAAVQLDYPQHLLEIQVVDDSTDETTAVVAQIVAGYRGQGIDIQHIHRRHRAGYKAGALANALCQARGQFVAIFDADFLPQPDFLQQTLPYFGERPLLGMIQTRWGHLNHNDSALTAAQSIALDKHFALDQTVRFRADLFPKFNGSAGIWRRQCLEDAGGWQADTVCEDLCLSTRAVLRGWSFCLLNDVVAPAELPVTFSAYKNQQSRWAKGATQCLLKYGRPILTSRRHRLMARLYALFSMGAYATHLLLLGLLLVQIPLIYLNFHFPPALLIFGLLGAGQFPLFILGQQVLYPDWRQRLRHFPVLLLIAIGLAPSNSRAVLQAALNRRHVFVRTPKGAPQPQHPLNQTRSQEGYRLPFDWIIAVELALALYALFGILLCLQGANRGPVLFLATCVLGFGYVGLYSLREQISR